MFFWPGSELTWGCFENTHRHTHARTHTNLPNENRQNTLFLMQGCGWMWCFSFTQEELRPHVTFLSPLLFLVFSRQEKRKADSVAEFCFFSPGRFVRSAVAVLDTPVLSNITTHPLSHRWHDSPPPHTHTHSFCPTRGVAPTSRYYFQSQISIVPCKADSYITQKRLRFQLRCSNKKREPNWTKPQRPACGCYYLYQANSWALEETVHNAALTGTEQL